MSQLLKEICKFSIYAVANFILLFQFVRLEKSKANCEVVLWHWYWMQNKLGDYKKKPALNCKKFCMCNTQQQQSLHYCWLTTCRKNEINQRKKRRQLQCQQQSVKQQAGLPTYAKIAQSEENIFQIKANKSWYFTPIHTHTHPFTHNTGSLKTLHKVLKNNTMRDGTTFNLLNSKINAQQLHEGRRKWRHCSSKRRPNKIRGSKGPRLGQWQQQKWPP